MAELRWSRTHGELGSVDPPGAVAAAAASSAPSQGGIGVAGATSPSPPIAPEWSAWAIASGTVGKAPEIESLEHLHHEIEADPGLAQQMLLAAMVRLRAGLLQIDSSAEVDEPVCLTAADAVVIARALLRRL